MVIWSINNVVSVGGDGRGVAPKTIYYIGLTRSEGEGVETIQDFFIKLDFNLLKISIFSLNNDIVRLTKIMNNLVKDLKILSFKVIF